VDCVNGYGKLGDQRFDQEYHRRFLDQHVVFFGISEGGEARSGLEGEAEGLT